MFTRLDLKKIYKSTTLRNKKLTLFLWFYQNNLSHGQSGIIIFTKLICENQRSFTNRKGKRHSLSFLEYRGEKRPIESWNFNSFASPSILCERYSNAIQKQNFRANTRFICKSCVTGLSKRHAMQAASLINTFHAAALWNSNCCASAIDAWLSCSADFASLFLKSAFHSVSKNIL